MTKTFNNLSKKNSKKNKSFEGEQYYKEEERIYQKYSEFHVSFHIDHLDLPSKWTFQSDIAQTKLLMVVKGENIPKIIKEIEIYINNNNNNNITIN